MTRKKFIKDIQYSFESILNEIEGKNVSDANKKML